ncbi:MAG: carboxypeptidase-like regulatory domain-containing protein [Ferruginibacter sp.]|nr:carboxypeptidase-like regulatory domain-containing protein [Ferruginibacter sp.]
MKRNWHFILFISTTAFLLIPGIVLSQTTIEGKVFYRDGATPAPFVNVEILNRPGTATMTNFKGDFSLRVGDSKKTDTILISSVGYTSIKLPLHIAAKRSAFVLNEIVKNLNGVTVFNSHEMVGSQSESVGFYRNWNHENSGGEIGRIFNLPHERFKIDKIRLKAGNTCDTCLLRLHIRYVEDGEPGEEIFTDSIGLLVNRLSLDSKVSEFDLTPYDFTFTEKTFFVGVEVLSCRNGKKGNCTFSFAGTEKGVYLYRNSNEEEAKWHATNPADDNYTIYLKLFLRF